MFEVLVDFADVPLALPQEGDQSLMKLFEALGFNQDELRRLKSTRKVCSSRAYRAPLEQHSIIDT